ncbi:hypothetical protein EYF80_001496 [Liparis tanakae]|uniref:Uncharacterized protein n=1 Tax=Liparis tanakae TaxID=230148 RepID=A0A4Z2JDM9_9TELE|nr:hypothetical protein EYF80_001496 [Liparis tanakae]
MKPRARPTHLDSQADLEPDKDGDGSLGRHSNVEFREEQLTAQQTHLWRLHIRSHRQHLCVLVVLLTVRPLLQRPGRLQLGDVGEEQSGLCLLPELHEPKLHTGHTEGHYGTLSEVKR